MYSKFCVPVLFLPKNREDSMVLPALHLVSGWNMRCHVDQ